MSPSCKILGEPGRAGVAVLAGPVPGVVMTIRYLVPVGDVQ
jgi:hypothetical protein